jgi:hypothetical protein
MMRSDELDYWRARTMQEQEAAQKAKCSTARLVHDQLATMCRFKVFALRRPGDGWQEPDDKEPAAIAAFTS